jgi:O-antigen/teichoic acid export membrane protein
VSGIPERRRAERAGATGFASDGALAGVSAIVANAASYVFYTAATRALGVSDGGALLAVIAAALMLSVPVGVAGLGLSGVVSHLRAIGDDGAVSAVLRRTTLVYAVTAALVLVAGVAGAQLVGAFFHVDQPLVALAGALIVVATAGLLLVRGFLQGFGEFRSLAASNVAEGVAKAAAAAGVLVLRPHFSAALAAFGGALLVAFAVSAALLYAHGGHHPPADRRAGTLRRAVPVVTAMGALTVMTFFDAIAARHYLAAHEAGLYNAAALAGRALMTLLAFVPAVLLPKVRERAATSGDTRAVMLPAIAFTTVVCAASLAVFVLAPHFVAIVIGGRAYADAAPLIPLYGVAAGALAIAGVVATYHAGHDRGYVGAALLVVMAAELTGILAFHDRASTILHVIVVGHVGALATAIAVGALESRLRPLAPCGAAGLAAEVVGVE